MFLRLKAPQEAGRVPAHRLNKEPSRGCRILTRSARRSGEVATAEEAGEHRLAPGVNGALPRILRGRHAAGWSAHDAIPEPDSLP